MSRRFQLLLHSERVCVLTACLVLFAIGFAGMAATFGG